MILMACKVRGAAVLVNDIDGVQSARRAAALVNDIDGVQSAWRAAVLVNDIDGAQGARASGNRESACSHSTDTKRG